MRLILIRHGQTDSNARGLLDTEPPGPPLDVRGLEQAAALVQTLADQSIATIHASDAVRAGQTAAPLAAARGLTVLRHSDLREVQAGGWEMAADNDSVWGYLRTVGSWMSGDLDRRTPGPTGTSGREVFERVDRAIAKIAAGPGPAVVVAHGAVLRCWASVRAVNLTDDFGTTHRLGNTDLIVLDRTDDGWLCRTWTGSDVSLPNDPTAEVIPVPTGSG